MGQYYMPTIIDDQDRVVSLLAHDFDNGLKLMEHSWIGNDFVNAVLLLLHNTPKRLAWVGDYSNEYAGDAYEVLPFEDFMRYYNIVWDENFVTMKSEQFTDTKAPLIDGHTTGMYFINHTKRVYIDVAVYIAKNIGTGDNAGWCINPLPLLTACGNGRGGGDYNYHAKVGLESVGTWAFDLIEVGDKIPEEYESVMYEFREWDI